MTIHKEGYRTIFYTIVFLLVVNGIFIAAGIEWLRVVIGILSLLFFIIILQFFRHPKRNIAINENHVIAPADGKVVVIEEVQETEYFKDKRIQLSIFMSPINVHVNRYPIAGMVKFMKYHPGLFLVAWHPKASTDNERTTVVVENPRLALLMRQIAGALAKRIVCYAKEGDAAQQGAEMGFIKFGSRVDVFLPVGTKINVQLNQVVTGGETVLAEVS